MNKGIDVRKKYQEQIRQSRIKTTKKFVVSQTKASYLNNVKWRELLERVEVLRIHFYYKTLLVENWRNCNFIRELEETAVLLDDSGDFIELLEIEAIKISHDERLMSFLEINTIHYFAQGEILVIPAYLRDLENDRLLT